MAWINYVYDPAHSAQIVAGAPYLSDVKGAGDELAKIAPDLAKSDAGQSAGRAAGPAPRLPCAEATTRTTEFNRIFQDAIGA